jgi:hypothetical protein
LLDEIGGDFSRFLFWFLIELGVSLDLSSGFAGWLHVAVQVVFLEVDYEEV